MTITEIEELARKNQPLNKYADNHVQLCYYSLQGLYNDYKANCITLSDAKVKKKSIRLCFELLDMDISHIKEMYGFYQDNVKLSSMLTSELIKQSANEDVKDCELLKQALDILALLTNEKVTSKVVFKNRALLNKKV